MLSDERALATRLASLDDVSLTGLLAARRVAATAAWHDFFDAAEALLSDDAVDRALAALPVDALRRLAGDDAPDLDALALTDAGRPYETVARRVAAARAARPDAFVEPAASEPVAADPAEEAAAAEIAITTTGSLADLLLVMLHAPLSRTGAGAVSAIDRRRLTDAGAVDSADELDDLITAASHAGLVRSSGREWFVTPAGEDWLEAPSVERWRRVVHGLRTAAPEGLRTPEGGLAALDSWPGAYPLDPDWPDTAARLARVARRLGLATPSGREPGWTTMLRTRGVVDERLIAALVPAEIDKVYLQADLTAIAPGPLAPELDLRLRGIARRESRAQASSYRFTTESLAAGMTEGETAGSVREFLSRLSLTGIPQPLEYLIESTAARHGLVRVRTDAASGRTRVESAVPELLETIGVDQALRPLGLVRDGGALASRVSRDAVHWALADARYPVVALDDQGRPEPLHRRTAGAPDPAADASVARHGRLIATLRASHGTDADGAWLVRELDQAVRARATLVVVVRLPDGSEREFALEATGLGGGRLRGRERGTDIERTLPVSSIASVRPA